jgi:hypothetical protein
MQVKIELINNFFGGNTGKNMKSFTTKDLTIEEATAIYEFLEKITKKLQTKGRDYWNKKDEESSQMFGLVLNETAKESDSNLSDEDWEGDWYIGD